MWRSGLPLYGWDTEKGDIGGEQRTTIEIKWVTYASPPVHQGGRNANWAKRLDVSRSERMGECSALRAGSVQRHFRVGEPL